jgi:hypothetical protein
MTLDATTRHGKPWLVLARLGAVGAAALAAEVAFDPQQRHVPLCPFHAATGLWCPFCGCLRGANALAHGHVGTAIRDNVLLVVGVVLAAAWAVDFLRRSSRGLPSMRLNRAGVVAIVVVLAAFTIVRNLPPGAFLAP